MNFVFISSHPTAAQAVRRDVLEAMRDKPAATLERIADRVKWQDSRVRNALEGMQRDGLVRCDEDGKWRIRG